MVAAEVGRVAARLGVVPAVELRAARERLDVAESELDVLRLELDDLQLRVATLEADSPGVDLAEDLPGPDLTDEPDLLGDETGAAGVRGRASRRRALAPETGDPRVDAALRGVDGLSAVPVDEHAERLSNAHSALQEVLRTPEAPPEPARPAGAPRS